MSLLCEGPPLPRRASPLRVPVAGKPAPRPFVAGRPPAGRHAPNGTHGHVLIDLLLRPQATCQLLVQGACRGAVEARGARTARPVECIPYLSVSLLARCSRVASSVANLARADEQRERASTTGPSRDGRGRRFCAHHCRRHAHAHRSAGRGVRARACLGRRRPPAGLRRTLPWLYLPWIHLPTMALFIAIMSSSLWLCLLWLCILWRLCSPWMHLPSAHLPSPGRRRDLRRDSVCARARRPACGGHPVRQHRLRPGGRG